jgi:hypothetical protein
LGNFISGHHFCAAALGHVVFSQGNSGMLHGNYRIIEWLYGFINHRKQFDTVHSLLRFSGFRRPLCHHADLLYCPKRGQNPLFPGKSHAICYQYYVGLFVVRPSVGAISGTCSLSHGHFAEKIRN